MKKPEELKIPLPNGGSLRCGRGGTWMWGGYLRICDKLGRELLHWDVAEWEQSPEGEQVIGAVFAAALEPLVELRRCAAIRRACASIQFPQPPTPLKKRVNHPIGQAV
jgi:hypothetical protein